jgi:hypothetical protein
MPRWCRPPARPSGPARPSNLNPSAALLIRPAWGRVRNAARGPDLSDFVCGRVRVRLRCQGEYDRLRRQQRILCRGRAPARRQAASRADPGFAALPLRRFDRGSTIGDRVFAGDDRPSRLRRARLPRPQPAALRHRIAAAPANGRSPELTDSASARWRLADQRPYRRQRIPNRRLKALRRFQSLAAVPSASRPGMPGTESSHSAS